MEKHSKSDRGKKNNVTDIYTRTVTDTEEYNYHKNNDFNEK